MHMRKGQEEQRHGVRAGYRGTRALREGGDWPDLTSPISCFASSSKSFRELLIIRSITADYKEHFGFLLVSRCHLLSYSRGCMKTMMGKFFKTKEVR